MEAMADNIPFHHPVMAAVVAEVGVVVVEAIPPLMVSLLRLQSA